MGVSVDHRLLNCIDCGKLRPLSRTGSWDMKRYQSRTRCNQCAMKLNRGPIHHNWKGGREISSGYVHILKPDHPFSNNRGYIREHRLVIENHIGRYLQPFEVVHHINGIKDDNRLENLELIDSHSEHMKQHLAERLKGHEYTYVTCFVCGTQFRTKPSAIKRGRSKYCSRKCWIINKRKG